jgi:chromosome segregation ATPase
MTYDPPDKETPHERADREHRQRVTEAMDELAAERALVCGQRDQITRLEGLLSDSWRNRARLLVEVSKLQDRNCALEAAMKSAENGFLQFDLANFSTTNDTLRAALAASQAEVERLRGELADRDRAVEQLIGDKRAISSDFTAATRRAEQAENRAGILEQCRLSEVERATKFRDRAERLEAALREARTNFETIISYRINEKGDIVKRCGYAIEAITAALSPAPGEGE